MTARTRNYGIVVIGNEVLSGKVQDLNATWLIEQVRELGGRVDQVAIIPDRLDVIAEVVRDFAARFDEVFTTGGIGPTHDDLTMEGIAMAFGRPRVESAELVRIIDDFFGAEKAPPYRVMARVPQGTELVWSEGMPFPETHVENVWIFPGDPAVLKRKFTALRERFREAPFFLHRLYTTLEEGEILELLSRIERETPGVQVGSYPVYDHPDFKVQVTVESKDAAALEIAFGGLRAAIPADRIVKIV
ncbi:MAG: competence/damage-inducible protein A [Planctomycetes bacterium]|nr:competence/damage-inducible protein A [Planctomycetota bacterium]